MNLGTLLFLDRGAGLKYISKSIVPLSRRNRTECFKVPLYSTTIRKPLKLDGFQPYYVSIGYLQVPVSSCAANRLAVWKRIRNVFLQRDVWSVFLFVRKVPLKTSRSLRSNVIGRRRKIFWSFLVAKDVWTVTNLQNRDERRVSRQTVIRWRSKPFILVVSKKGSQQIVELKSITEEKEHQTNAPRRRKHFTDSTLLCHSEELVKQSDSRTEKNG